MIKFGSTKISVAALFGLLLVATVACTSANEPDTQPPSEGTESDFHGLVLEPIEAAPDFTLTDQHGDAFTLSEQQGKTVLLFFGYTFCPDVCPTTLADFAQIRRTLGEEADRVEFVFISVDPERDTQEVIGRYVGKFDESFIGLRGEGDVLDAVKADYGVFSAPETTEEGHEHDYLVTHSSFTYLVDPEGMLTVFYPFGTTAPDITADLRQVLG